MSCQARRWVGRDPNPRTLIERYLAPDGVADRMARGAIGVQSSSRESTLSMAPVNIWGRAGGRYQDRKACDRPTPVSIPSGIRLWPCPRMGRIVSLVEMWESRPPPETVADSLDCRCRAPGNKAIYVVGQGLAIDRHPLQWRRTGNGEGWTLLPTPL